MSYASWRASVALPSGRANGTCIHSGQGALIPTGSGKYQPLQWCRLSWLNTQLGYQAGLQSKHRDWPKIAEEKDECWPTQWGAPSELESGSKLGEGLLHQRQMGGKGWWRHLHLLIYKRGELGKVALYLSLKWKRWGFWRQDVGEMNTQERNTEKKQAGLGQKDGYSAVSASGSFKHFFLSSSIHKRWEDFTRPQNSDCIRCQQPPQ